MKESIEKTLKEMAADECIVVTRTGCVAGSDNDVEAFVMATRCGPAFTVRFGQEERPVHRQRLWLAPTFTTPIHGHKPWRGREVVTTNPTDAAAAFAAFRAYIGRWNYEPIAIGLEIGWKPVGE